MMRHRHKMVQDGTRWYKMVQDGTRWYKMVQDGGLLIRSSISIFLTVALKWNCVCKFFITEAKFLCCLTIRVTPRKIFLSAFCIRCKRFFRPAFRISYFYLLIEKCIDMLIKSTIRQIHQLLPSFRNNLLSLFS